MIRNAIRFIYRSIPFKSAIFKMLRSIYTPSSYRHLHFVGWFSVKVDESKSFVMKHYGFELENELFWNGLNGWESTSLKIWTILSKNSNVILDVGANTGVYALLSQCVNKPARVFAFEPVHRVFEKLEENVRRNNFAIKPFEVALSNRNGEAVIYDQPTEHIYSVTVNQVTAPAGTSVIPTKVQIITISSFLKEQGIQRVDLIKLDVEFHEPEVLEGFPEINNLAPIFLIELLIPEIAERVNRLMNGYRWFKVCERKRKLIDLGTSATLVQDNDGYNYLAIPVKKFNTVYPEIQQFISVA